MHCKTCNYPLWNLKARQCPECGSAFTPSEFEFVINSVRFCCPQCDQAYYGTGVKGHLLPEEFNCVKCGIRIRMDEMVLRPAEGVHEEQTKVSRTPWLERHERGRLWSWFSTVIQSMGSPGRMVKGMPADSPQGQAWLYAAITIGLIMFVGAMLPLGVISLFMFLSGEPDAPQPLLAGLGIMLIGTVTILVLAWIWAAVTHGMLRITGGAAYGMSRTVQAVLYGCGTQAALAVPIVGLYCGSWIVPLWWIVAAVIMVSASQRIHGGRATFAVLTFPVLLVMAFIAMYFVMIFSFMSGAGFGTNLATAGQGGALSFSQSLRAYAQSHGGYGPDHAALLMTSSAAPTFASEFVIVGSDSDESFVPAGDITLNDLQLLPTNRKALAAQALADALPADVIAHRLGDFVFTYHGIDFTTADPGLWTVVCSPDPAFNSSSFIMPIMIGKVDGSVQTYQQGTFVGALAAQNSLRQAAGLPPLSDPRLVTHEAPMTVTATSAEDSETTDENE